MTSPLSQFANARILFVALELVAAAATGSRCQRARLI